MDDDNLPEGIVASRAAETLRQRLRFCRAMLNVHGLLAPSWNDAITKRIKKYCDQRDKERESGD